MNPAAEARGKAQAIWLGASVSARGRKSIEHQHPTENRFMLDVGIGPMHYGADQEIDTAWQSGTAPWDREMVKAGYNAFALEDFSSGQIVKYVDPVSGEDIAFQPQQLQYTNDLDQIQPIEDPQSVNAVVTDDELYWIGAFGTDLDLKWQTQTARLDKRLIIQDLAALPAVQQFIIDGGNPVLRLQFIFQHSNGVNLFVNDVEWDEKANNPVETSGVVEFRDSLDNVLWTFNLPRSEDVGDDEEGEFVGTFRFRKTGPNLFVEHLVPVSWLQAASYPVEIDVTVDAQVDTNTNNDAREGATVVDLTSRATVDDSGEYYGHRWTGIIISAGATIDTAYIDINIRNANTDEPNHPLYFEDSATPAVFTTGASDISNRTGTTATATFGDGTDQGSGDNTWWSTLVTQPDPEIKTIIQELVDSYDYSSGLAMVGILQGGADANDDLGRNDYTNDTTLAAKLHIEYTAAAAGAMPQSMDMNYRRRAA